MVGTTAARRAMSGGGSNSIMILPIDYQRRPRDFKVHGNLYGPISAPTGTVTGLDRRGEDGIETGKQEIQALHAP